MQGHCRLPDVSRNKWFLSALVSQSIYVVVIFIGSFEAATGVKTEADIAFRLEHDRRDADHVCLNIVRLRLDNGQM